jgi:hypothetical protein
MSSDKNQDIKVSEDSNIVNYSPDRDCFLEFLKTAKYKEDDKIHDLSHSLSIYFGINNTYEDHMNEIENYLKIFDLSSKNKINYNINSNLLNKNSLKNKPYCYNCISNFDDILKIKGLQKDNLIIFFDRSIINMLLFKKLGLKKISVFETEKLIDCIMSIFQHIKQKGKQLPKNVFDKMSIKTRCFIEKITKFIEDYFN